MSKRIIPVSSGKGGVGKTSFAVSLALSLSKVGKTVLVDLDTGTSSIRNTVRTPVGRDLYHFLKKGVSFSQCITPLSDKMDPTGTFKNFGFIASPKHMISDIVNMDQDVRNQIIDGINSLDADYIILDLRAGLDPCVIDFTPQSNTGILVFTPNHPAATLSASDIAKAIIFRNLRNLFGAKSELYRHFAGIDPRLVNRMIDIAEDSYDRSLINLDAFVMALHQQHPGHPFVNMIYHIVRRFQLYYVLNRFDGVDNSYETAVKPLVENINNHISTRLTINNLGWIIESQEYHESNTKGVPYMLAQAQPKARPKAAPKKTRIDARMEELYALAGLKKGHSKAAIDAPARSTDAVLDEQRTAMQSMYDHRQQETVAQNIDYIASSIRYTFENKKASEFGTPRILKSEELVPRLLARKSRQRN